MICTQITRVLWLFLSILIFRNDVVFASLLEGTLVATAHGLVPIQKLKVGDKVLSYNLNVKNHDKAVREVAVTKIDQHATDSIFTLCTENGWVEASPQQLIFTLIPTSSKPGDALVMDFVQAQNITEDYMLIDEHMQCLPIFETNKLALSGTYPNQYIEIATYKRKRKKAVTRNIIKVNVYALEVETPHVFLIAENSHAEANSKPRLLLTHNGIPTLIPATYHLATSSALSFPSVLGGLSVVGGPVGLALGITGLGFLGYQLFKSHHSNSKPSFRIERANSSSPGGYDPKEPNDNKDEKDASGASDFEKKICKMSPNERVATIITEAKAVAKSRGLKLDKIVSQKNKRFVYRDPKTDILYSVDTQHGRFEVLKENGTHLGEVNFDFNFTKNADKSGKHDLITK